MPPPLAPNGGAGGIEIEMHICLVFLHPTPRDTIDFPISFKTDLLKAVLPALISAEALRP